MKIEELNSFLSPWRLLTLEQVLPAQVRDQDPTQPTSCRASEALDAEHKGALVPQPSTSIWEKGGQKVLQFRCKRISPNISGSNQKCIQHDVCKSAVTHIQNKQRNLKDSKAQQYLSKRFSDSKSETTEYQYSGCLCNHYLFTFRSSQELNNHIVLFLMQGWGHTLHSSSTQSSLHSSLIMQCFSSNSCPNTLNMTKS